MSRFNRDYEVFKKMRGTAPYFEESKKNLMALIRQKGCPTVFLTLSCAEYDWQELLKEIAETVYRRSFSWTEIEEMSVKKKNKLINENYVQSTLHFNKRFQKLFSLMQYDFFGNEDDCYHVSTYYFRVEFQQRGAPHIHSLLWLKNKKLEDAPAYWKNEDIQNENPTEKSKKLEEFADLLLSTSSREIACSKHKNLPLDVVSSCTDCTKLKEKITRYQTHNHSAT